MNEPMAPTLSKVRVVIVNFRTPDLTQDCIRSLAGEIEALPGLRISVVDNASGDGSREQLRDFVAARGLVGRVEVIARGENMGFAAGNNAAFLRALEESEPPDYFLLLNPDTIARDGAVRELLAFMERTPGAGIAGSRLEDPDGTPQRSAFRFPSLLGELESSVRLGLLTRCLETWVVAPPVPETVVQADWVAGASLLVRREVLEAVGLMDEGYFLYYEETDFCLAARRAGWTCHYVPSSRVVHLRGRASGVTRPGARERRPRYWFESRRRYFVKNHGKLYAACADLLWIAGLVSWRLRSFFQGRADAEPRHLLRDFIQHSVLLRGA